MHAEACTHLHRTVGYIKEQGCQVGVAINPATPLAAVEEVLPDLDIVLVMTVNPGFGGQSFIPAALGNCDGFIARSPITVTVCNWRSMGASKADDTARDSVAAGAGILVAGTAIFNREQSVAEAMAALRDTVSGMSPGNE